MKYFIVVNKGQEEHPLLYHIADVLWNSGNQIYISSNYRDRADHQYIVKRCDYIVFLIDKESSLAAFFRQGMTLLLSKLDLLGAPFKKRILVFSTDGVYSSEVPFPHGKR